jgi:hypothetical protein
MTLGGIFLHSETTRYIFSSSYRRITFFLILYLDCTIFRLRSIGRPVKVKDLAASGNVSNEIEQKEISNRKKERRTGEKREKERERERNVEITYEASGVVQILRHCVPRLSHIWFTHIFLSRLRSSKVLRRDLTGSDSRILAES